MGVAGLIFEPHPPNFKNQCDFWRCSNDPKMISLLVSDFQRSVWSVPSISVAVLALVVQIAANLSCQLANICPNAKLINTHSSGRLKRVEENRICTSISCQLSSQYLPKNAKMQYSLWWKIKTGESDLYPYIFWRGLHVKAAPLVWWIDARVSRRRNLAGIWSWGRP